MKANELRKGVYVRDRGGKELLIDFIDMPNNKVGMNMLVMGVPVHPLTEFIDYLQPIPLTKEWLERFEVLNPEYPYSFEVAIIGGEYRIIWNGIMKEVRYVNQLQNLYFALIGEELTIKN
ncbi:hypothetical protein Phi13:2_gp061 [Cellulophaga phage phi13:2]|uniref:Uncharacterized protein n=1 Tax=Cellulophaga phage phi13:2 TaxID=1328030 RepID=S0A2N7_9CAUD|nr:hypothetical protein Phi13:2_gp061 [Cellulophaga phage phi13:2]AGO49671.1 hypothetical protein Phi13:2_gp061 [Cellulophaga phage phi13:2]